MRFRTNSTLSLLFCMALLGSSCASNPPTRAEVDGEESGERVYLSTVLKSDTPPATQVSVEEIIAADAEVEPEPHSRVPIDINPHVEKWIEYFSVKDHARFRTFLERGLYYKHVVNEILDEQGVPKEMYYLAMIESGYVTHATSRQSAVGAWQFIRATGKRYGLRSTRYLDERRDVLKATRSAARYLKDLHDEFGSWYLAMAAYNAGEGRIRKAIRKGHTHDFWALVKKRALPRETMNYVPKFLAAVIIGKNAEKYGFNNLKSNEQFPKVAKAEVPPSIRLTEIARVSEIPYDTLQDINPQLVQGMTPRDMAGYEIWVPESKVDEVEDSSLNFAKYDGPVAHPNYGRKIASSRSKRSYKKPQPIRLKKHRVKRGETLHSISQRYQVPVSDLKKMNGIKGNRVFLGQSLRVRSGQI